MLFGKNTADCRRRLPHPHLLPLCASARLAELLALRYPACSCKQCVQSPWAASASSGRHSSRPVGAVQVLEASGWFYDRFMTCLGPTGPLPERPTDWLPGTRVCRWGGQQRIPAGRPPALPLRRKLLERRAAYVSAMSQKWPRIDTVHAYTRPTDSDMSRPTTGPSRHVLRAQQPRCPTSGWSEGAPSALPRAVGLPRNRAAPVSAQAFRRRGSTTCTATGGTDDAAAGGRRGRGREHDSRHARVSTTMR
jgi:hypothetical protein